ncbi:MAG: RdgB/HAM1 family non-canonical purine NTP pyrophosphatase [Alphaproteobacteria bacterium]|nr:RdgB/HAM1 family non-canonical purine NTP pyrophosphatase [Alphaproteobacteria bacterium]
MLGKVLVLATHNPGKVREIEALLRSFYEGAIYSAADLNLPEPEETGASFTENASLKALAAARASGKPSLADDSGLSVTALDGVPGIYSARWAGPDKDFDVAMCRVHEELGESVDRSAAFVCVLALAQPDGRVDTFEGRVEGQIVWPPRGVGGFGYDPIFVPEGHDVTFAEMDPAEKEKISHRARAFEKLKNSYIRPAE